MKTYSELLLELSHKTLGSYVKKAQKRLNSAASVEGAKHGRLQAHLDTNDDGLLTRKGKEHVRKKLEKDLVHPHMYDQDEHDTPFGSAQSTSNTIKFSHKDEKMVSSHKKHKAGMNRAISRLSKPENRLKAVREDYDMILELSRKTLSSYLSKASDEQSSRHHFGSQNKAYHRTIKHLAKGKFLNKEGEKEYANTLKEPDIELPHNRGVRERKIKNTEKGMSRAVDRLTGKANLKKPESKSTAKVINFPGK